MADRVDWSPLSTWLLFVLAWCGSLPLFFHLGVQFPDLSLKNAFTDSQVGAHALKSCKLLIEGGFLAFSRGLNTELESKVRLLNIAKLGS